METLFGPALATWGIPISAIIGICFALFLWYRVSAIKVRGSGAASSQNGRECEFRQGIWLRHLTIQTPHRAAEDSPADLLEEEQRGESEVRALC